MSAYQPVLDPACGGRMFWFDKSDDRVLFGDVRDESWELCDGIVWQKMVPPRVNAILTPDSTGSKLILDYVQSYNDLSYRRRPASEILWAMVKANGKRTN